MFDHGLCSCVSNGALKTICVCTGLFLSVLHRSIHILIWGNCLGWENTHPLCFNKGYSILSEFQLSTCIQLLICKPHSFFLLGIHSANVSAQKTESILWINPEITHVELWMIFCTWISSRWKTVVDLCSNWNKQLVKSCTCEEWKQGKRGAGV